MAPFHPDRIQPSVQTTANGQHQHSVCREDIKTPPSSRSPSPSNSLPDIRAIDALQHVYSPLATFIDPTDTPHTKVEQDQEDLEHAAAEGSEEQEFEFRLFYSRASRAGPAADNSETASTKQTRQLNKKEEEASSNGDRGNTTDGIQKLKIRLRSLSPGQAGEGGFVVPFRGWDYYLSDPEMVMRVLDGGHRHNDAEGSGDVNSHVRGEFIDVAVSGEEVLAGAKSSRWVCHVLRRLCDPNELAGKKKTNYVSINNSQDVVSPGGSFMPSTPPQPISR